VIKKILLSMNLPSGDLNNKKNLNNIEKTSMIEIIIEKINTSQSSKINTSLNSRININLNSHIHTNKRISIQEMISTTMNKTITIGGMMITKEEALESQMTLFQSNLARPPATLTIQNTKLSLANTGRNQENANSEMVALFITVIKEEVKLKMIITTIELTKKKTTVIIMIRPMIRIMTELQDLPINSEVVLAEEEEAIEVEEEEIGEDITRVSTEHKIILKASMEIININQISINKSKRTIIKIPLMNNTNPINSSTQPKHSINNKWILRTRHTCPDLAPSFTVKHRRQIK